MSSRKRLALDAGLFVALLVAYYPARTGISLHEWLSLAIVVPLLVHLVINWDWTVKVMSRFSRNLFATSRLNLVVDVGLFLTSVTVMLSGVMISSAIASTLHITLASNVIWYALHSVSADVTVALLLVHLSLHWRWIARALGLVGSRGASPSPMTVSTVAPGPARATALGVSPGGPSVSRTGASETPSVSRGAPIRGYE